NRQEVAVGGVEKVGYPPAVAVEGQPQRPGDPVTVRLDHDVLDVMLHFSQHIGAPPVQLSLTCLPRPSIGAAEHRSTARTRTRRPRWSGQIQVSDGGQDGNVATNDNTLFMVHGVFFP